MFALHRQSGSFATRFFFGIAVLFVCALTCSFNSHTANAQLRIGIGVGGIGGAIGGAVMDDAYRRQKSQQDEQYRRRQSATESDSRKKSAKAKNQKPKKDGSTIAKDSPPKAKPPEPVASAPQTAPTTPLTAGPPPASSNFGE